MTNLGLSGERKQHINHDSAKGSLSSFTNRAQQILQCDTTELIINATEAATFNCSTNKLKNVKSPLNLYVATPIANSYLTKTQINLGERFSLITQTHKATELGKYIFTITVSNHDVIEQLSVKLTILPPNATHYTFTNPEKLTIPENLTQGVISTLQFAE